MRIIRSRITSAHLIALLALFVALGGSAYAIHLGKNAVKTKNIKNGAVIESKLADGAVSAAKLAGGAVSAGKLADGAVGAKSLGSVVVRRAATAMPDGTNRVAIATCPSGERLIGGSAGVTASNSPDIVVTTSDATLADGSAPVGGQSPTSWYVLGNNYVGADTSTPSLIANALCLK
jgi:hypothetical protein